MSHGRGAYRSDIDGLRGVAVLAVLVFHLGAAWLPGGFAGVDIFFVISGFLITGIIHRSHTAGRFLFLDFWARRVRRIFPALLIVLCATVAAGWLYLLPTEFAALKSHVLWSLGFAINFKLHSESGYFDLAAALKPLLHLWSLAVEEQFYLIWPILIWCMVRFRVSVMTATVVLLTASVLTPWIGGASTSAAFYYPWCRFWELLGGAVVAFAPGGADQGLWRNRRLGDAASVVGLVLIGAAFLRIDGTSKWLPLEMAVPVAGAVLLVAAGPLACTNRWLLSMRPLVWVGKISYPLYLWHWPALSLTRILFASRMPDGPTAKISLGIAAVSGVLAVATYWAVERPLRCEGAGRRWRAPALAGSMLALGCLVAFVPLAPRSKSMQLEQIDAALNSWAYPSPMMQPRRVSPHVTAFDLHTRVPGLVLFIGDSHMEQYAPRVEQVGLEQPDAAMSSVWLLQGACLPIGGYKSDAICDEITDYLVKILHEPTHFGIERVVWTENWRAYFEDGLNGQVDSAGQALRGAAKVAARVEGVRALMAAITRSGLPLTVIQDTPHGNEFDPRMIQRSVAGRFMIGAASVRRDEMAVRRGRSDAFLIESAQALGAEVIDPLPTLCPEGLCPVRDESGRPLLRDYEHFTEYAARARLKFVDPVVLERPKRSP